MLHEDCDKDSFGEYGKVMFVKTGEHTSVIYGTHYPNRLFVGCLPPDVGAEDLGSFFSAFGNVVEAKVVLDQYGRSKRFGFVTFSDPGKVESLIAGENIWFKGKKINVGPAVKKNLEPDALQKQQPKPAAKAFVGVPNNAQHIAKTIVRRSPTESLQQHLQPDHTSECAFRSIWGITDQAASIWAPLNETRVRAEVPYPTQEKSFSFLRQMQENNNHYWPSRFHCSHAAPFPTYSNGNLRAPPGFN